MKHLPKFGVLFFTLLITSTFIVSGCLAKPDVKTYEATRTAQSVSAPKNNTTTTKTSRLTADQWNAELFRLTNAERTNAGLPALQPGSSNLQTAASIRAKEISTSFSHVRPNGTSFLTVLTDNGVSCSAAGENILMASAGSLSPAAVMSAWMNSSGHRANILSTTYTQLSIGYYRAGGYDYFVQLFIRTP